MSPGNHRQQWRGLAIEKKLSIVVVPIVIAAISVGIPPPAAAAGTVLVSAPYLPAPGVFWSGTKYEESYEGAGSAEVERCLQDNEATLERMLALDGERSPQMGPGLLEPL